jgi:hypothetical protein
VAAQINEQGCIHRDFHPWNIMFTIDGAAVAVDPEMAKFVTNGFDAQPQTTIFSFDALVRPKSLPTISIVVL